MLSGVHREYDRRDHTDDDPEGPPEADIAPKELDKRPAAHRDHRDRDLFDDAPEKKGIHDRDPGWDDPEEWVEFFMHKCWCVSCFMCEWDQC